MFLTKDKWIKINNYHLIAIIFILLITQFFFPWQILLFETILIFIGSVSLILTTKYSDISETIQINQRKIKLSKQIKLSILIYIGILQSLLFICVIAFAGLFNQSSILNVWGQFILKNGGTFGLVIKPLILVCFIIFLFTALIFYAFTSSKLIENGLNKKLADRILQPFSKVGLTHFQ